MVICLERGADLHIAQLMPLPLTISCSSKIQIGFYVSGTGSRVCVCVRACVRACVVPADLGSPGKRAIKWVYVFVYNTGF